MEPHNESDLLQLANAKDGTYLMTVREIGRNRELATPLNGITDRRVSCQLASNATPGRPMARGPCVREWQWLLETNLNTQ
jgi:hypothetical protein